MLELGTVRSGESEERKFPAETAARAKGDQRRAKAVRRRGFCTHLRNGKKTREAGEYGVGREGAHRGPRRCGQVRDWEL